MDCDTVCFCRRIPMFGRNTLPPSSGWRIYSVMKAGCKEGGHSDPWGGGGGKENFLTIPIPPAMRNNPVALRRDDSLPAVPIGLDLASFPHSLPRASAAIFFATCVYNRSRTPRLLWNPKAHYRGHKNGILNRILGQLNPVYTHISLFTSNFNCIIPSTNTYVCRIRGFHSGGYEEYLLGYDAV
jgi:hypothetical protein